MALPRFSAGADGFFRFGPELADWASLMVAMEVERRNGSKASRTEQATWAQMFDETVRPTYGQPHTPDQFEQLERQLRRFIKHTAANHLQICQMRAWRDSRRRSS